MFKKKVENQKTSFRLNKIIPWTESIMDLGDNLTSVFDDDDLQSIKSGGKYDVTQYEGVAGTDTPEVHKVRTSGL